MKYTTIKLTPETKKRLEHLKIHKRETFDDLLNKFLNLINLCRVDPNAVKSKLYQLERAKSISSEMSRTKPEPKSSSKSSNPQ